MSGRDEAECALRASEARLKEAQAVARMGDWEVDRATGAMSWSSQLFRLFERDEALGAPDLNEALGYYDRDSLERTRAAFWKAIDDGERVELEQTVELPSGARRFHLATLVPVKAPDGRVTKLYGTVQDITERKLAEQELVRKTREIEDLYENAPCGYYSVDPDERVIRINDTHLRWLGYARDEVVGRMRSTELFTRESAVILRKAFAAFKTTGVMHNLEVDLLRRDGSVLPVVLSSTAIRDEHGRFVASRTMVSDNSDRKQLERERAAHTARLAELSRRMVDVQENERRVLADELHARASPNLAALQLTLASLVHLLPRPAPAGLQPLLDDAKALLLDTTNGIRHICAELRPAALDYAGLIPALHDYAQQFGVRTGIAVSLNTDDCEHELPANLQSVLFRIVQEALTNSAKHAKAKRIDIRLARDERGLNMTIRDDGVGFDPKHPGSGEGAPGLGLITMRERAEFAGGSFALRTAAGTGTEITVRFADPGQLPADASKRTIENYLSRQACRS